MHSLGQGTSMDLAETTGFRSAIHLYGLARTSVCRRRRNGPLNSHTLRDCLNVRRVAHTLCIVGGQ